MRKRFHNTSLSKPMIIKLTDVEKDNINCRIIGKVGLCGSRCYLYIKFKLYICNKKII